MTSLPSVRSSLGLSRSAHHGSGLLLLGSLIFGWGCGGSSDAGGSTTQTGTTSMTGDGGATQDGSIPAIRAQGQVTWTLVFDADAQKQGYSDCSYTRSFEGLQALDLGYLCPDCAVLVQGQATMTQGLDCYQQISSSAEEQRAESWGWSADGRFFRTSPDLLPLGELTTLDPADGSASSATDVAVGWDSEGELSKGGNLTLTASGTVSWWTDPDTLLPDPWPTQTEPYACGWPQDDPGTLELGYDLAVGSTVPNVRLVDQCDQKLALWDLTGRWLVMDTTQPDCGPCRSMASTAEDFVDGMAAEGVEVVVVSLLGAGLAEPYNEPDDETYQSWLDGYAPTGPLLRDRGYGYAIFPTLAEEVAGESFGYPTWVVVAPDMTIYHVNVGFSDWDAVAEVIRDGILSDGFLSDGA